MENQIGIIFTLVFLNLSDSVLNSNFLESFGTDLCQNDKLECYECDSRNDDNCKDPFNNSLPLDKFPASRMCNGCCTKIEFTYPTGKWIQRSCSDSVIDYSWISRACHKGLDGHIKMCVCSGNDLCNKTPVWNCSLKLIFGLCLLSFVNHVF